MSLLSDIKLLRLMRRLDAGKLDAKLLAETPLPPLAEPERFDDVVSFDVNAWRARKKKALR